MAKFYKTVIQVEVISEGPYDWENLAQVYNDITWGDTSGRVSKVSSNELTHQELVEECGEQGTDIEFFLGEE
jgi:hypothetical protein